jgi:putative endonuclease
MRYSKRLIFKNF